MNRNMLLAALFFLLLITGYNQFIVLPRVRAQQQAAEQELAQAKQDLALTDSAAPLAQAKTSTLPEELITFQAPQAQVTFTTKGAGIKQYLFEDVVAHVDLTPYKGEGFFTTLPQLDFREAARTQDSIVFTAQWAPGVELRKTYRFGENGLGSVNLTLNNRTQREVTLPAFDFNFGPGMATVNSELSDNERESKAVYLTQEPGKKNPTLVKFTAKDKSPVSGKDWIWAGVQNRYFLSVLVPQNWTAGALSTKKEVVTTQKRLWGLFGESDVEGPQMRIAVPAQTVGAKSSQELKSDFYFVKKFLGTYPFFVFKS